MKKILFITCILFACVSCKNTPVSTNPADYDSVKIEAGNGDTVMVPIPYMVKTGSMFPGIKINTLRWVMQRHFNVLKDECNYPRTFIPTELPFSYINDSILCHCVNKEHKVDTLVWIYITTTSVNGIARNAYGTPGDVSDYITMAFTKGSWVNVYMSPNKQYMSGEVITLYKDMNDFKQKHPSDTMINLNGVDYLLFTEDIWRFIK